MKKLFFFISIAAVTFACQQQQATTQSSTTSTGGDNVAIAYINNDTLLTYYKYAEERREEFQAKVEKGSKQLQSRVNKLQKEAANFQKRAQAGLVSKNEYNKKAQEFAQKEQELAIAQQSQQQGLAAEEMEMVTDIKERVKTFVDDYSKDQYSIVLGLGENTTSTLVWSTPNAKDITWIVIDSLNADYKKEIESADTAE